jgi:hypothetical protein
MVLYLFFDELLLLILKMNVKTNKGKALLYQKPIFIRNSDHPEFGFYYFSTSVTVVKKVDGQ